MSTSAKLFVAAVVTLALGLAIGFFPIHAGAADCGAAFMSQADEFNAYGRDLCGGKVAMLRYPAIILIIVGLALAGCGSYARSNSETWTPIR